MLTKTVIGSRIKALRAEKELSQEEFGEPVGLSKSALSQIERGETFPSLETLDKIVKHYSTHWDTLMEGNPNGNQSGNLKGNPSVKTGFKHPDSEKNRGGSERNDGYAVRHLVTTVDRTGRDTITLVAVKAQAGYLQGASDREYIEHQPSFYVPGLRNGLFRAFEVSGYSMLADRIGFFPGDIVIGQYVENIRDIKDGRVYVLVNNAQDQDDIVLKRCLNYMDKGGVIICKSDNKDPQYPTFPLPIENIKEVWEFKMKMTRQAPEPGGLFERINSLEGDMVFIKEQLRKLLP